MVEAIIAFPRAKLLPMEEWENIRESLNQPHVIELAGFLDRDGQFQQPPKCYLDQLRDLYVPVFGFHRFAAYLQTQLELIQAIITDKPPSKAQLREWQLVENLARVDMKPMSRARAVIALREENGETNKQTAERLGIKSPSLLTDWEAMCHLPIDMQESIDAGTLSESSAACLARCNDPTVREELYRQILAGALNRDQVKRAVQAAKGGPRPYEKRADADKPKVITLEAEGVTIRVSVKPDANPAALYTLAGKLQRASEPAKKENDIKLFLERFA